MNIKNLPEPPPGFSKTDVESRDATDEDQIIIVGACNQWQRAGSYFSGTRCICAIPVKLTGTDWLEALALGTKFLFNKEVYFVSLMRGDDAKRLHITPATMGNLAACYQQYGKWQNLHTCFPNGYENLSDETCEHPAQRSVK